MYEKGVFSISPFSMFSLIHCFAIKHLLPKPKADKKSYHNIETVLRSGYGLLLILVCIMTDAISSNGLFNIQFEVQCTSVKSNTFF